ncbi:isochorismatase family protein [Agrobacterium tumefaciens]|uniref:isochorismatase family protein n=1 Tax=Agrobacterium tumefaciens TaxID=358 RepID=UPI0009BA8A34
MAALSCFPLRPTARSRIGAGGVRHWRPARKWGAFSGSDLQTLLLSRGVTQVVLCGTAASVGVESTARQPII